MNSNEQHEPVRVGAPKRRPLTLDDIANLPEEERLRIGTAYQKFLHEQNLGWGRPYVPPPEPDAAAAAAGFRAWVAREQAKMERISELWRIHDPRDGAASPGGRCLAFEIGQRYLEVEGRAGLQFRLGASFGHNPFTPTTAQGFLPPPVPPGKFVIGLHVVAHQGDQLTIYDQWVDAREAPECEDPEQMLDLACAVLESISDEKYLAYVRECASAEGPLEISGLYLLEDFEVAPPKAF